MLHLHEWVRSQGSHPFVKLFCFLQIYRVLQCGHTFCKDCLNDIIQHKMYQCPHCKTPMQDSVNSIPKNFVILCKRVEK